MSRQTLTFKAADARKAIEMDPNGFLTLSLQKNKKEYTCTYLDMTIKAGNVTSNGLWISGGGLAGQPNSGGFVLAANVLDSEKAKEKFKDDPESQRRRLTTTVSKSGDMGAIATNLNGIFKDKVEALAATGVIVIKNRTICMFAQTNISDESKEVSLRGKAIDDPIIRFVIDFSAPKEWYRKGYAWGKTVTQFLDYNKPYTVEGKDGKKITKYEELMWTNDNGEEEPVSAENMHRVLTAGSIVHEYTIWYGNPSISKAYVSSKATITRCVIECIDNTIENIAEPDFGNAANNSDVKIVSAAEVAGSTSATTSATNTPTTENAAADGAVANDAINDLLDSI